MKIRLKLINSYIFFIVILCIIGLFNVYINEFYSCSVDYETELRYCRKLSYKMDDYGIILQALDLLEFFVGLILLGVMFISPIIFTISFTLLNEDNYKNNKIIKNLFKKIYFYSFIISFILLLFLFIRMIQPY